MVAKNNPNEIRLIRTYDAPAQVVWDAWNEPDQVAQWWGPRGFTITTHHKDLRVGGSWHYTMHGPDGVDYVNTTIYHEVEECKKLVYDHGGHADRPPLFHVTVLFSEANGQTTMEMTMRLSTAEEAERIRKMIKAASGNSTWDRLAEYLDETKRHKSSFVINRSFAARPEQLFDMWTKPDQLTQWLPPPDFEMSILSAEIRVGGICWFKMSSTDAMLHGKLEYLDISPPERLVYVQRFCDERGDLSRHPGLPLFPDALLMTVQFVPEDEVNTRVTVVCEPFGDTSPDEVAVFLQTRSSMTGGWNASFDKLESLLL